jgi:hypothetical protein
MLVGNGAADKTELVKRLIGTSIATLIIEGVELTIYDCAGQKEYVYTHPLFFDKRCVAVAVLHPRTP